ncbi:hypothetical protein BLOT_003864 [Blomia tropicalis]|nr:hypothetical protein BLOT_003864 [Blomia tropicalis]
MKQTNKDDDDNKKWQPQLFKLVSFYYSIFYFASHSITFNVELNGIGYTNWFEVKRITIIVSYSTHSIEHRSSFDRRPITLDRFRPPPNDRLLNMI